MLFFNKDLQHGSFVWKGLSGWLGMNNEEGFCSVVPTGSVFSCEEDGLSSNTLTNPLFSWCHKSTVLPWRSHFAPRHPQSVKWACKMVFASPPILLTRSNLFPVHFLMSFVCDNVSFAGGVWHHFTIIVLMGQNRNAVISSHCLSCPACVCVSCYPACHSCYRLCVPIQFCPFVSLSARDSPVSSLYVCVCLYLCVCPEVQCHL